MMRLFAKSVVLLSLVTVSSGKQSDRETIEAITGEDGVPVTLVDCPNISGKYYIKPSQVWGNAYVRQRIDMALIGVYSTNEIESDASIQHDEVGGIIKFSISKDESFERNVTCYEKNIVFELKLDSCVDGVCHKKHLTKRYSITESGDLIIHSSGSSTDSRGRDIKEDAWHIFKLKAK